MARHFLIILLLLTSHYSAADKIADFVFMANRQGEIEPCGCVVNQLGGIHRAERYLKDSFDKKIPRVVVDSGDTFFSALQIPKTREEQEKLKAQIIAEAFKRWRVDVITPGERDFAFGLPFLNELQKKSGVRFLSANILGGDKQYEFERFTVLERKGLKLGVLALSTQDGFNGIEGITVAPPLEALQEVVGRIKKEEVEGIILLSHLGLPADREIGASGLVDLIFGSHSLDTTPQPILAGRTVIVQPQFQGMQIGKVRFDFTTHKILHYELVNLDSQFDADNESAKALFDYKEKIRLRSLGQSGSIIPSPKTPFVAHPFLCRNCHAQQYDFWASTKHASSYLVLYAKNQHFDPECVGCHTLGFEMGGGFQKITLPLEMKSAKKTKPPFVETLMQKVFAGDPKKPVDSRLEPARYQKLTDKFRNQIHLLERSGQIDRNFLGVQCEHCHGIRQGHPGSVTQKKVDIETCRTCHQPPNASPLDPASIVKVACPLMQGG